VSCYTRHLGAWLPPEPSWEDRRALDAAVRSELGLAEADCPEVWAAVKDDRDRLDARFAARRSGRGEA
jgi:hypothetical protein